MLAGRRGAVHFGWQRRDIGQGGEKIVGFVEEVDFGVAFAPCGGQEDSGLAAGAEGDVGSEAGASSGFLHQRGGCIRAADLNPGETDSGWIAGMTQALNGFELLRPEINIERAGRLCGRPWNMQQVLKQLDHVRGG